MLPSKLNQLLRAAAFALIIASIGPTTLRAAAIPGLFNTGVDNLGVALPNDPARSTPTTF